MGLYWMVALLCIPACLGHVRLTWPEARYPQLDFLDNVRTGLPCGVPFNVAKSVITTVTAGQAIDLKWHLGFAHRGGVQANLLTPTATYNLTAGWVHSSNPTSLSLRINLPALITCAAGNGSDCILQIRHQALEWGPNYVFHSCADLNIIAAPSTASSCGARNGKVCSGNGACVNSQCMCNRLASGTFCQNVDECTANSDCGGNTRGVCVTTQATSYPKKQCYCRAGYMGPACMKESTLKNAMIVESEYQNKMKFSDNYYMYWRTIPGTTPEIEIALKVRTSSWVGLGWRSAGVTSACQAKPATTRRGTNARLCRPAGEPEPTAEAEATPSAAPEGGPEGEPESEPEPSKTLPICDANGNPPTAEPEAEATAEPEATPEATAEPEATPEATAEPEGEPEGEPENAPSGSALSHAMDCRDMIVAMANGCSFRIHDSYSRDRSTPQPDSFFGGSDDLKGAVGMENDGWTYIKFMRKMNTASNWDYPFTTSSPMSFIWAHGQRQGAYTFNVMPSGVNEPAASDKQFYKDDELKYHGFRGNRGSTTVDLSSRRVTPSTAAPSSLIDYSEPQGCTGAACNYKVTGQLDASRTNVIITLSWTNAANWVALGTSKNMVMTSTDLTMARMGASGIVLEDRFATAYSLPPLDTDQSQVTLVSSTSQNGVNTVTLRRPCMTNNAQDISFDGSYLVYASGPVSGGIPQQHSSNPILSSAVLSANCQAAPAGEPETTGEAEPEATTEPAAEGTPEPETTAEPEGEPSNNGPAATPAAPVTEQMLSTNMCHGIDYSSSGAGQIFISWLLIAVALFLAL